ncbi:MAG: response regulator [Bacteroidetes bacterium]|nr:response regulator [Bacteroidota bacterium]
MQAKNLKIKTRLLIGFGAVLSMVLLLGGMAFWHSGVIWQNTDYLYQHPFKVNIAVREIETNIMAIQRSMKNVALSENQEELNAAVHDINIRESEVYRLFDTIYLSYLGKKSSVDSALSAIKDWKPVRDETIRLSQAGQKREAIMRTKTIGEIHVALAMKKVEILKEFALNRAQSFYQSAEKGRNLLYLQLWLVVILIFAGSMAIIIFILRGISKPLQGLVSFSENYGEGQYHVRNDYQSTNEFGTLAASMNKLAETVQFEMNVKNGTLQIADAMLANDDLPAFCSSVLNLLMEKTNSSLGAFYLLNEDSDMFEPYFSCGFSRENLRSFSAETNEGEFGKVLLGAKLIKITQIPADSVFTFSTVAGSVRPAEIISIPVIRREKVIAIVSLASISAFTAEAHEIVRQTEKNLNMSVNAILAFERIRENAAVLDRQNEKLSIQAKELQVQTRELVEQNTELEIQKHQIDEANKLKSQFLSSMSHELRTPLNSVIALSGVLYKRLKNQISSEEYSYLEIIERNGKNLLALINDILDLSRIESGKTEIQYETFPVNEIVHHILASLQMQIREKNLEVKNLIGTEIPMLTSDRDKCHHILQNIITNAVKFTNAGSVEVSAKSNGSEIALTVKDTGIGIPANQLPFIFNEFRQVDGTTSRQYGGTGLGLAIAEKFAMKLSARIDVESEPGKGSAFTVIFPIEPPSGKPLSMAHPGLSSSYRPEAQLSELKKSQASEKTILIVEDSEPAIVQLSWILREQGYQVDIARNGFEALEAVKVKIPDAIILDLMMPGIDGFEVLEKIRGNSETANIPVLILTAMYLDASDLTRLTRNNIHQLVQKGDINKIALLSIVRQMMFPNQEPVPGIIPAQTTRQKTKAPARILIIDDNPDNETTIKVLLQDKHTIITATNGPEGVAAAGNQKPDMILLDISLPGMDGFRVFDEIRKNDLLRQIPVIAVTAKAMKGDREQILAHGFDGYISKPIDVAVFEETINKWIT